MQFVPDEMITISDVNKKSANAHYTFTLSKT